MATKKLEIEIEVEANRGVIDMEIYDQSEGETVEIVHSKDRVSDAILDAIVSNITSHVEDLYDDDDDNLKDSICDDLEMDFEDYGLDDVAEISIKCREVNE